MIPIFVSVVGFCAWASVGLPWQSAVEGLSSQLQHSPGAPMGTQAPRPPEGGETVLSAPAATASTRIVHGVGYTAMYPGNTLDQRVNACMADAEAQTNGLTSGICSSEGEPAVIPSGPTGITSPIIIGDGSHWVTWRLPAHCSWSINETGGKVAIYQKGDSRIIGQGEPRDSCELINNSGNGGLRWIYQNPGPGYYEFSGLVLSNKKYTLGSNTVMFINGAYDNSSFHDFGVNSYVPNTVGINIGNAGPCCSTSLYNFYVYGNDTGGIPLQFAGLVQGQGIWMHDVSLGHPASGLPIIYLNDSSSATLPSLGQIGITGLYIEPNKSDSSTALVQMKKWGSFSVDKVKVHNVSTTTTDNAPFIVIPPGAPVSVHIGSLSMQQHYGIQVPAVIDERLPSSTTTCVGHVSAFSAACTDSHGELTEYNSNESYFDSIRASTSVDSQAYTTGGSPLIASTKVRLDATGTSSVALNGSYLTLPNCFPSDLTSDTLARCTETLSGSKVQLKIIGKPGDVIKLLVVSGTQ